MYGQLSPFESSSPYLGPGASAFTLRANTYETSPPSGFVMSMTNDHTR